MAQKFGGRDLVTSVRATLAVLWLLIPVKMVVKSWFKVFQMPALASPQNRVCSLKRLCVVCPSGNAENT